MGISAILSLCHEKSLTMRATKALSLCGYWLFFQEAIANKVQLKFNLKTILRYIITATALRCTYWAKCLLERMVDSFQASCCFGSQESASYKQKRIGKGKKTFRALKVCIMSLDADGVTSGAGSY